MMHLEKKDLLAIADAIPGVHAQVRDELAQADEGAIPTADALIQKIVCRVRDHFDQVSKGEGGDEETRQQAGKLAHALKSASFHPNDTYTL